jgi:HPt (histidine-containing phosphotransfer) domain-containing protein
LIVAVERRQQDLPSGLPAAAEPPPPTDGQEPAVAAQFGEMRGMLGDDEMQEIVDIFSKNAETLLAVLIAPDAATEDKAEAAHALKGAADMIGLPEITALARDVMYALRAEDIERAHDIIRQLPAKVDQGSALLRNILGV